ncbi:MAG TPA: sulfatase, partial [Planctomycetaceae bacterium]
MNRRELLNNFGMGLGAIALCDLMNPSMVRAVEDDALLPSGHFPARAKRVIYLFQSGGPSQMDLLDYKPLLNEKHGEQLPDEVRGTQRLTGMSGNQSSLPLVGSPFKFAKHGEAGLWMSDQLPHTAKIADELCVINSMYTDAINHGPGVTHMQTGSQFPGRPSIGAWLNYGL